MNHPRTWQEWIDQARRSPVLGSVLAGSSFSMKVRRDRQELTPEQMDTCVGVVFGSCLSPHITDGDLILVEHVSLPVQISAGSLVVVSSQSSIAQGGVKVIWKFGEEWCFLSNDPPLAADRFDVDKGEGIAGCVVAWLHRAVPAPRPHHMTEQFDRAKAVFDAKGCRSQAWRDSELGLAGVSAEQIDSIVAAAFCNFVSVHLE